MNSDNRYHRQAILPGIGEAGQKKLGAASVLLVGCGALGTVLAEQLVRAGVGRLRIADRDVVELTNLQRQVLFDEADAMAGTPKAVAAAQRLTRVNSSVIVEARVLDVHSGNIEELATVGGKKVDVILDGTDNADTRYLLNDVSVKHSIPWIYGGCVGTQGRVMGVIPGGPCLRCVFPDPPAAGEVEACDTAGVLGPVAALVASLQATACIQILVGQLVPPHLLAMDGWTGVFQKIHVGEPSPDCPCCGRREFQFLNRPIESTTANLCGRNAVQIRPAISNGIDLKSLSEKLAAVGTVQRTSMLLKCQLADPTGFSLTVFPDGRLIIQGTTDITRARSIANRYLG